MPRNGSGVYSLPPGTPGVPETPVESPPYNNFIADIENDANLPRPIVAGGTGASTPAQAITNLGGFPVTGGTLVGPLGIHAANPSFTLRPTAANQSRYFIGTDHAANAARWVMALGDNAPESTPGSNIGSDFAINRYNDAGSFVETPLSIKRSDGVVTLAHTLNLYNNPMIRFGGNQTIYRTGNYLALTDGFAGASLGAILIGNLNDPVTYYDNTSHLWRNRLAGNMMALSASALQVFSGIFANATGNVLETTSGYTVLREAAASNGAKLTLGAAADPGNYHDNTNHYFRPRGGATVFGVINNTGLEMNGQVKSNTVVIGRQAVWSDSDNGGASSMLFGLYRAGDIRYHFYASAGLYWTANLATGSLNWISSGGSTLYELRNDGNLVLNVGHGYKPGGGDWLATSDARIKTIKGTFAHGLDAICELTPKVFTYKGNDTVDDPNAPRPAAPVPDKNGKLVQPPASREAATVPYHNSPNRDAAEKQTQFVGFVAQEIEALGLGALMVKKRDGYIDGQKVTDLRDIDTAPLIYALVNAIKELTARVEALESV